MQRLNQTAYSSLLGLINSTSGYSYGELTAIANNAIFQYRDMYLRPNFYIENEERSEGDRDVITQYANGEIDYTKAEFDARVKIYQSVNPAFNPDEEFAKDTCYRVFLSY